MKVGDFKGKAVVSLSEGARVGTVTDVVLDGLAVSGLIIHGQNGEGFLSNEHVNAHGPDAITIDSINAVQWNRGRRMNHGTEMHDFKRMVVIDAHGKVLGHVHDVVLDSTGHLESIAVREGGVLGIGGHETVIPSTRVRAVGEKLITVDTHVEPEATSAPLPNQDPRNEPHNRH